MASCKIPEGSDGVYKYELQSKDQGRPLGGPIYMHVDGCKGCPSWLHKRHQIVALPPPTHPGDPEPVYLDCDPGKQAYAEPHENEGVSRSNALQWAAIGKESITWTVSNIPATICDGASFTHSNPYCVVKADAVPTTMPTTYNIDRGGGTPGTASLTILDPSVRPK